MKKILDLLQRDAAGSHEMIVGLKAFAVEHQKYELGAAIRDYERTTFPEKTKEGNEMVRKEKPSRSIVIETRRSKDNPKKTILSVESEGFENHAEIIGALEMAKLDTCSLAQGR